MPLIFRRLFGQTDHFAPHSYSGFEGYYCRTQLEDGGTLAVIFCSVYGAKYRNKYIHASYTPLEPCPEIGFKYDWYPEYFHLEVGEPAPDGTRPFSIDAPGFGRMEVTPSSTKIVLFVLEEQLKLEVELTDRVPWSASDPLAGPMGSFARLSRIQPLNWHVYSTASTAQYAIVHGGHTRSGTGVAHLEKNWGRTFPAGWIWSQTFGAEERRLCLAGGRALPGIQAYLVGYRSPSLAWDFRPPATAFFSGSKGSPTIRVRHDCRAGIFSLRIKVLTRMLVVEIEASPDSFVGMSCPLKDGHQPNYAFESFSAKVRVEAWTRRWPWNDWECVEKGFCGESSAALEFGGSFSHLVKTDEPSQLYQFLRRPRKQVEGPVAV
ncbi:hypothetical protein OBBRIDRAFT_827644 [Obba rivulosa]|uniref:Tocopherol cyclase n=1 Tax=Obba rivulosa TaxID=1052685 RepID=A0A8E2AY00_9APHY|nr:hypothetical protein OBBRIDRAFT_827644 [Obba rivulosa]